ncbi:MAG: tripartite tricarboxylate transporter substrate binding protein [Chloroflexota bacterium]
MIVPYAPGGGTDANARMVAAGMEKVLGSPVQVVNKAGAGSQLGVTELVQAKPDGYTVGATSQPGTTLLYLDKERKAIFERKNFTPIATYGSDPQFLVVKADSPFKTTKDLIDAAKANPDKVKIGTSGLLGAEHVAIMLFAQLANIKPAAVHFEGSGPAATALMGGHIDAYVANMPTIASPYKAGQVRVLSVWDDNESALAPGVKTLKSEGFNVTARISRVMSAPAGTSKEIVDVLAGAIKKTVEDEAYKKKAAEMYLAPKFMGPEETLKAWADEEAIMRPLVETVTKDR